MLAIRRYAPISNIMIAPLSIPKLDPFNQTGLSFSYDVYKELCIYSLLILFSYGIRFNAFDLFSFE